MSGPRREGPGPLKTNSILKRAAFGRFAFYVINFKNNKVCIIGGINLFLDKYSQYSTSNSASHAEMIEALTFTGPSGERVQTSGASDKTANIALNYQKKLTQLEKDAQEEISTRLLALRKIVERLDFYINETAAAGGCNFERVLL